MRVKGHRLIERRAMTEVDERKQDRIARRQVDKFAERRDQLAAAALATPALLRHLSGDATAAEDLDAHARQVLPTLLA